MRRVLTIVSLALALGFVSGPLNATDITQLQGITGKVVNEDIYWGTGEATDTFSVPTYTGGTVTLTKVPSLASNLESILKGVWYVSNSSSITDHGNATVAGSLAWVVAAAGSTDKIKIVMPAGTYPLVTAVTIPSNITLDMTGGAVISGSASALIMDSPAQILARLDQQVFDCTGTCATFSTPGTIYVDWWGTDRGGVNDAYADLNATIESVPATSTVVLGRGIYLTGTGLNVTKGVNLTGACSAKNTDGTYGSTIKATTGLTGTLLTWEPASPYIGHVTISCIHLDGNAIASDGLKIKQGAIFKVEDVAAYDFTARGFWVDGWASGTAALETLTYNYANGITFDRCEAQANSKGFAVERAGTGVWGTVSFRDCYAKDNYVGLFVRGDNATSSDTYYYDKYGTTVAWDGGNLEGKSSVAWDILVRAKDGANVAVSNTYTETYSSDPKHYWLSGNSYASVSGGPTSPVYWYSRFDDNSTLCMEASGNNAGYWNTLYGGMTYYGFLSERMCVGGKIADKTTYGSPWIPTDKTLAGNTLAYKGMRFVDNYGTQYVQVEDNGTGYSGTETGGTGILNNASRWAPINGRIIIPVTFSDLNRDNFVPFWAEADFVMTALDFVVEEAFTQGNSNTYCNSGAAYVSFGTTTHSGQFISPTQGAVANLGNSASIRAYDNDNATNALGVTYTSTSTSVHESDNKTITTTTTTKSDGKLYFMPGYSAASMTTGWDTTYPTSYVRLKACPSDLTLAAETTTGKWTAGKGWLIISGYNLEYNRYGE